jgi:hypothetical protein
VYGVDIKNVPVLDKKINDYACKKSKSRTKKISSLWIKKMKEQRDAKSSFRPIITPKKNSELDSSNL